MPFDRYTNLLEFFISADGHLSALAGGHHGVGFRSEVQRETVGDDVGGVQLLSRCPPTSRALWIGMTF